MSKSNAVKIIGKGFGKVAGAGGLMALAFWLGTTNKTLFNSGRDDIKQGINLFKNSLRDEENELEDDLFDDY